MSIKIYHGAPGSYKTSGAVAWDFVDAVLAGRLIYTNIRGLCDKVLVIAEIERNSGKVVPESFDLKYIDTDVPENMDMVRRWWHWMPVGALMIWDEIQIIYPDTLTKDDLLKLDAHDSDPEKCKELGVFMTLAQALQQHRHKNWDIVLTTTNIRLVHKTIRHNAEVAYRHVNMAIYGSMFKGRYKEAAHSPSNTGQSARDVFVEQSKRIPQYVFRLYKSTATGRVTDTKAGSSIFKNFKVSLLLFLLVAFWVLAGYLFFARGDDSVISPPVAGDKKQVDNAVPPSPKTDQKAAGSNTTSSVVLGSVATKNNSNTVNNVGIVAANSLPPRLRFLESAPILQMDSYLQMYGETRYSIRVPVNGGSIILDEQATKNLGLKFTYYSRCYSTLRYGEYVFSVACKADNPIVDNQSKPLIDSIIPASL